MNDEPMTPPLSNQAEPPTWLETLAKAGARSVPTNVGAGLHIVAEDVIARRRSRLERTAEELAAEVGADELSRRMSTDPQIEALVAQVLEASLDAADERKRRALSRVAANALTDDAVVDESQLVVLALRQLEAPHIRVLVQAAEVVHRHNNNDSHAQMREIAEVIFAAPRAVISVLASVGALDQLNVVGNVNVYRVADLGLRIVAELLQEQAQST